MANQVLVCVAIVCIVPCQAAAEPRAIESGSDSCSDDPVFQKQLGIHQSLKKLLRHATEPKMRADTLFRLAENYVQMSQTCPALVKVNLVRAIEVYRKILAEFPDYPQQVDVLFYLATALWDLERRKEALKVYMQVAKKGGKYAPDVFLAFGEFYFDQARMDKAKMAYLKVISYPDSPVANYARYKLGWVYYNLQEWEQSGEYFRQVLELTADQNPRPALYEEALKDITRVYGHFASAEEAPRVFRQLAPEREQEMLERLAALWFGDGKLADSIKIRRHLVGTASSALDAAFHQLRIVECMAHIGDKQKVLREAEEFAGMLTRLPPGTSERTRSIRKEAKSLIGELARVWALETRKAHPEATALSDRLNALYRSTFPDGP
jgi:tetratricopeptide (TPR) repeat protein